MREPKEIIREIRPIRAIRASDVLSGRLHLSRVPAAFEAECPAHLSRGALHLDGGASRNYSKRPEMISMTASNTPPAALPTTSAAAPTA